MATPPRPQPDAIIASEWGGWVHDICAGARPPAVWTPKVFQNTEVSGTATGTVLRTGGLVHAWGSFEATGSGTAATAVALVLPVPAVLPAGYVVGSVQIATANGYIGVAQLQDANGVVFRVTSAHAAPHGLGTFGADPNVALATGHRLRFQLTYLATG